MVDKNSIVELKYIRQCLINLCTDLQNTNDVNLVALFDTATNCDEKPSFLKLKEVFYALEKYVSDIPHTVFNHKSSYGDGNYVLEHFRVYMINNRKKYHDSSSDTDFINPEPLSEYECIRYDLLIFREELTQLKKIKLASGISKIEELFEEALKKQNNELFATVCSKMRNFTMCVCRPTTKSYQRIEKISKDILNKLEMCNHKYKDYEYDTTPKEKEDEKLINITTKNESVIDNKESLISSVLGKRQLCPGGVNCQNQLPKHHKKFIHPKQKCPYGDDCDDISSEHFKLFTHSGDNLE